MTDSAKEYIHRHRNGSLWAKGTMAGKKKEGYWEWFRKDGSKMRSGFFKKDKQIGNWTTYDKQGNTVKITNFDKK